MGSKTPKLVEIKTKPTALSVDEFINSIADAQKREDSAVLIDIMSKETGEEPVLWSNSIIGFGNKRYRSERTGREVDWLIIGFSPRKANLSLHLTVDINKHQELLQKLGKHKTGVGCLYISKLEHVDLDVLRSLIKVALERQ